MKKILWIIAIITSLILPACEQPDIPDAPNYDKTEILSFKLYDKNKENVIIGTPVIDTATGTISTTIQSGTDLTGLFATCGLSSGATIYPSLGGYQNWSEKSKQFTVTSASGTRQQQWNIVLTISEEQ